jgi:hypothetical protein
MPYCPSVIDVRPVDLGGRLKSWLDRLLNSHRKQATIEQQLNVAIIKDATSGDQHLFRRTRVLLLVGEQSMVHEYSIFLTISTTYMYSNK